MQEIIDRLRVENTQYEQRIVGFHNMADAQEVNVRKLIVRNEETIAALTTQGE